VSGDLARARARDDAPPAGSVADDAPPAGSVAGAGTAA
jgi:hypothetical protein